MSNQDMPANPATRVETRNTEGFGALSCDVTYSGETKREKAIWQVYSAMLVHSDTCELTFYDTARVAIKAVDAMFKALEGKAK